MKVRCWDIDWDTGEERDIYLPSEVELDIDPEILQDAEGVGLEESEVVGDELTELVGWCHFGFYYEVLETAAA